MPWSAFSRTPRGERGVGTRGRRETGPGRRLRAGPAGVVDRGHTILRRGCPRLLAEGGALGAARLPSRAGPGTASRAAPAVRGRAADRAADLVPSAARPSVVGRRSVCSIAV